MGVPYFLRNLIPKREKRTEARPLLEVLAELTWVQWAQFFSGSVKHFFCSLDLRILMDVGLIKVSQVAGMDV